MLARIKCYKNLNIMTVQQLQTIYAFTIKSYLPMLQEYFLHSLIDSVVFTTTKPIYCLITDHRPTV